MSKEILHTDKDLGVCPFCQQPVNLYRRRLWTDNGHGYYGNYNYEVGCMNATNVLNWIKILKLGKMLRIVTKKISKSL